MSPLQETVDDHPPSTFFLQEPYGCLGAASFPAVPVAGLHGADGGAAVCHGVRLVDRAAGLAAAFLGAVSPMYLWYSQEARPYALVTCLGLFSFYCFLRAFVGRPGQPERRLGRGA